MTTAIDALLPATARLALAALGIVARGESEPMALALLADLAERLVHPASAADLYDAVRSTALIASSQLGGTRGAP